MRMHNSAYHSVPLTSCKIRLSPRSTTRIKSHRSPNYSLSYGDHSGTSRLKLVFCTLSPKQCYNYYYHFNSYNCISSSLDYLQSNPAPRMNTKSLIFQLITLMLDVRPHNRYHNNYTPFGPYQTYNESLGL
uniref:Uncharacterized protein n=1 Tax=Lepeophtheirus salmonis TaxID=72036 RepID=A0A0K2TI98_LEPSM